MAHVGFPDGSFGISFKNHSTGNITVSELLLCCITCSFFVISFYVSLLINYLVLGTGYAQDQMIVCFNPGYVEYRLLCIMFVRNYGRRFFFNLYSLCLSRD